MWHISQNGKKTLSLESFFGNIYITDAVDASHQASNHIIIISLAHNPDFEKEGF